MTKQAQHQIAKGEYTLRPKDHFELLEWAERIIAGGIERGRSRETGREPFLRQIKAQKCPICLRIFDFIMDGICNRCAAEGECSNAYKMGKIEKRKRVATV